MSNTPRDVTRNQLAEFLPNQRTVRAMEQLLKQVNMLLPEDIATLNRMIQESYIEAASGAAKAQVALDALTSIAKSLEMLATAPVVQPAPMQVDVSPPARQPSFSELADASIKTPAANNILSYDATLRVWKNASSGAEIHAVASKATPVDADEMPLADSASSFSLKKLTWANLKATLATWLQSALIPVVLLTVKSGKTGTAGVFEIARSADGLSASILTMVGNDLIVDNAAGDVIIKCGSVERVRATATGATIAGTITTTGGATFHTTNTALTNGAGVGAGTLLTAPVAGNPTKWIGINDNGTTRYIPSW